MPDKELLKELEKEYEWQKEQLEKERKRAYEQWRRALGMAGVLPSGAGAKALGQIEETYSRALGELTRQLSMQRTLLKRAEAEKKKQTLGALLQAGFTILGSAIGLSPVGGAIGTAIGKLMGAGGEGGEISKDIISALKRTTGIQVSTGLAQTLASAIGTALGWTSPTGLASSLGGLMSAIYGYPSAVKEAKFLDIYSEIFRQMFGTTPQQMIETPTTPTTIPPAIETKEKK